MTYIIQRLVKYKDTKKSIEQLVFENIKEDCQAILHPIREREDIVAYLKGIPFKFYKKHVNAI